MKIFEVAQELRLQNKDVLAKAEELGIDAKNIRVELSDEDAQTLRNALKGGGAAPAGPVRAKKPEAPAKGKPADKPAPKTGKAQAPADKPKKDEKAAAPKKAPGGKKPAPAKTEEAAAPEVPFVPRRVTKEELKQEEKAKGIDGEAAAEGEETAEGKAGKKPQEPKKKPELSVARPEKLGEKDELEIELEKKKKAEEEKKTKKVETPEDTAPAEEGAPASAPEEAAPPEPKPEPETAEPAQEAEAAPRPPVKEPAGEKTRKPEDGERPQGPRGGKPTKTEGGRPKPEGKDKDKRPGSKVGQGTDKQTGAGKDDKKKGPRGKDDKKKGPGRRDEGGRKPQRGKDTGRKSDDFRGGAKTPILEEGLLEKQARKRGHRPSKPQGPTVEEIKRKEIEAAEEEGAKIMTVPITVAGFAEQTERSTSEIIMTLMGMGIMANINQNLDETTVLLLGEELGISIYIAEDEGELVEEGIEDFEDAEEDLLPRPPIITVMGHVDHGKTSLLDAIRKTNVTSGEAGGITQHIGAYEAKINGEKIVFLDTPGHEAFTAMRARGAHVTDIAILVVAADDGVMPQTVESISHAKAAGVPIIVAVNKIDKEGANIDRVLKELADHGVLVEAWGGETISVPVSAKTGEGITSLLEMILLQAEVLELKANPNRLAKGTVIEAYLDKARGSVATLLVQNGTLEVGMSVVAGTTSGRIRAMTDYSGKRIRKAEPSTAVEITGLSDVPQAGDSFNALKDDHQARAIAENRRTKQRDEIMARTSGASLETLFSRISEENMKELNIIIKGDVQGSVGALTSSLEKLSNDEVKVHIIHTGVGTVNESDVMLAGTSDSIIIGFNVRPSAAVMAMAERDGVEIRTYRVIYDAIGEVEAAMKGMLDPEFKEVVIGQVEIRETFKVPGAGVVGGAYVTDGKVSRNAQVRIVRDGIVVHDGKISSLRRFKDDVREVAAGYECGIGIENYNDIKQGDVVEAFVMEEIKRD
ncbi:MAG: translation initiation factor IF-2 [Clostridiales Family XIII bacterium]|jgi:translation initiation factor IF-2|nr:translation initiation factor IF-2 [Clostridiales Family XIII bacterium]